MQLTAIDTLLNVVLPERVLSSRRRVALIIEVRAPGGAMGAYERGLVPSGPVPAEVFEPLARALSDLNPRVRVNAAYAIAVIAAPDAGKVPGAVRNTMATSLTVMLAAPDADERLAAARAAGRAFRESLTAPLRSVRPAPAPLSDALINLINAPTPQEQSAAIEALGLMRDVRSLQALTERFTYYRSEGPRGLALVALEAVGRIAHPGSADLVRALATDKWASKDDDTVLTVAFARERVLADGSVAQIREGATRQRIRARAEAYLFELGLNP